MNEVSIAIYHQLISGIVEKSLKNLLWTLEFQSKYLDFPQCHQITDAQINL